MVNKYCHGQQDKVCNHKGNHLPLVDNGYYVYYYWLLFYSQLPKYQYLIYDWSENVLNKNVVVVARGERLCSLPLPSTPTLNQVVITTTTTKIQPCLPCALSILQCAHSVRQLLDRFRVLGIRIP